MNQPSNSRLRSIVEKHALSLDATAYAAYTAAIAAVLGYFGLLSGALALGFLLLFFLFLSAAFLALR